MKCIALVLHPAEVKFLGTFIQYMEANMTTLNFQSFTCDSDIYIPIEKYLSVCTSSNVQFLLTKL